MRPRSPSNQRSPQARIYDGVSVAARPDEAPHTAPVTAVNELESEGWRAASSASPASDLSETQAIYHPRALLPLPAGTRERRRAAAAADRRSIRQRECVLLLAAPLLVAACSLTHLHHLRQCASGSLSYSTPTQAARPASATTITTTAAAARRARHPSPSLCPGGVRRRGLKRAGWREGGHAPHCNTDRSSSLVAARASANDRASERE